MVTMCLPGLQLQGAEWTKCLHCWALTASPGSAQTLTAGSQDVKADPFLEGRQSFWGWLGLCHPRAMEWSRILPPYFPSLFPLLRARHVVWQLSQFLLHHIALCSQIFPLMMCLHISSSLSSCFSRDPVAGSCSDHLGKAYFLSDMLCYDP